MLSIGLLLLGINGLKAQEPMSFNTINGESYRLFLEEKWDSVLIMGREGIRQDMDFYYLRIRMGIACYNQKKYRQAAGHFKQALAFNLDDPLALEYLYYSYLFSGQADLAALVRKRFKGQLAHKLPPLKGKAIDHLGLEYLYNKGLTGDILSDPALFFSGLSTGVQYVTKSYSNTALSISSSILPGFRLNQQLTYLSKSNIQYYNDGLYTLLLDHQEVKQFQYYLSPSITLKSGFMLMPMFHLLSIHYQTPVATGSGGTGFQGGSNGLAMGNLDEMSLVSGLSINKFAGLLDLQLGAWYANLNKKQQFQGRLGLTAYPLGNLNFYAGAFLNSQYEMTDSSGVFRFIPEIKLGFAIAGKIWGDLYASFGDMTNYLEQNGAIVYNSYYEVIQKKAGLTLSIPVSEKGSLIYFGGRWSARQSEFSTLNPEQTEIINPIPYNALSFYGGITWKF